MQIRTDNSNYDIAMDFYQSLMHHIVNNADTHVDVNDILEYLKLIQITDKT